MITPTELRSRFCLQLDGSVTWRGGKSAGTPAGFVKQSRGKSYWMVDLGCNPRKQVMRSRAVFCLEHGRWPNGEVDHINGNSLDDRPLNLREATRTQNCRNVKHRAKASPLPMGIRRLKSGRYFTRIQVDGKRLTIGTFTSIDAAVSAYRSARQQHFGEFA